EVITRLLREDKPITLQGDYYQLQDAILLPHPERAGGTRMLIGGNGEKRTLPLVARYANEWNGVFLPPARYTERNARLTALLEKEGRDPQQVRRSLMTRVVFGRDEAAMHAELAEMGTTAEAARERGIVVGTAAAVQEQLGQLAEAGVQRVMLQWMALDDLDRLAALAEAVL
ncbi:MAG: LLM class flavin-dependent oxidoreductase, partial [Caldilineaceae bacterium]|nr:LLM class flavin-dependent oxidoreductase [Caldilineaceae bacterium]